MKRERQAIKQLISDHEYEVARAKAASCIRDELVCEAFALLEILIATGKQRFQMMSMYGKTCPAELEEPWHTIVFAATRTDVPEFKEITNQLMLLYGEEWGRLANVDAHGLANQRVVRKLTIFANDTLVKQYLVDVMGPDFDPEICFGTSTAVIGDDADDRAPQNAAQMERELAALRAAGSAAAPLSTTATAPVAPAAAAESFRPVSDDDKSDDDSNGGGGGGGGFPVPPPDLLSSKPAPIDHVPAVPEHKHVEHVTPTKSTPVPTPPTSPPAPLAPSAPITSVQNDHFIQKETASTAADDLLARFEALKPKRKQPAAAEPPHQPTAPAAAAAATSAAAEPDDAATLDLLMSFPPVATGADELKGSSGADIVLPSVPGDSDTIGGGGGGDDDEGGAALGLPSTPTAPLGRGIKSGSKEEKELDEVDDLAARFERLKHGR